MDIHKPKAAHSLREFLIEIGTIICGILIALGLEQVIEAVHRQEVIREARRALNAEVGFDLVSLDYTASQSSCINQKLDELGRWRASFEGRTPLGLSSTVLFAPVRVFRTSVWRVASVASIAQMPFEDRVRYGEVYDRLQVIQEQRNRVQDYWSDLVKFSLAKRLDESQRLQVDFELLMLRRLYVGMERNAGFVRRSAHELGARPEEADLSARAMLDSQVKAFCRPLLAGKA